MHPKEAAYHGLNQNRQKVMERFKLDWIDHTPPSEHYPHRYKWDSGFFIEIYTEAARFGLQERDTVLAGNGDYADLLESKRQSIARGYENMAKDALRKAVSESFSLFKGQEESGMIPNVHFAPAGRSRDPERNSAFGPDAIGSSYDQPSVTAVPILDLCKLIGDINEYESGLIRDQQQAFLGEIYGPLRRSLDFWDQARTDGRDNLSAVVHPHETGRDSDPTFDKFKPHRSAEPKAAQGKISGKILAAADYHDSLELSKAVARAQGDAEKLKEVMWVKDVMMNCIHVDNLFAMSELATLAGRPDDARHYNERAQLVQDDIIKKMYDPADKIFYNIDKDDSRIKEVSINNLFPLLLPDLPAEQLEAVLDLMDRGFDTPYPLPSVATFSSKFDPNNFEFQRLWRGSKWINVDAYLTDRGLLMQAERKDLPLQLQARCLAWAEKVTYSSYYVVSTHGAREFYNPLTSAAQRGNVPNFGWSFKAYTMKMLDRLGLDKVELEQRKTNKSILRRAFRST